MMFNRLNLIYTVQCIHMIILIQAQGQLNLLEWEVCASCEPISSGLLVYKSDKIEHQLPPSSKPQK